MVVNLVFSRRHVAREKIIKAAILYLLEDWDNAINVVSFGLNTSSIINSPPSILSVYPLH